MKKAISPLLQRFWRTAQPWVISLGLVLILRYTGILGAISNFAGTLLLKTGIMDAPVDAPAVIHEFTYDFTLQDLDGRLLNVQELRGRTLFINLWATWCGPCRIEMPSIESLYARTDSSRVVFIVLSVDDFGNADKVRKFVNDRKFTFPVYIPTGALPPSLQVPSIPTTMVVAPDGKIVVRKSGLANYDTDEFAAFLNAL